MVNNLCPGRVIAIRPQYNKPPVFQVCWNGKLCKPTWKKRMVAEKYLHELVMGERKPEWAPGTSW